jgi:formiminotetrahydrofolate cyclodeaminase
MKSVACDISIRDFLRAVAAIDEPHGAVSAAAVCGGIGASLLMTVAALPKTRADSMSDRMRLMEASTALSEVQEQLLETVETETTVRIFAARNMPQASGVERAGRQVALQVALRAAADVPLEVMRLCARGLTHAESVAAHCSRAALAEAQLGVALLQAAFEGARSKLEDKVSSLTDAQHVTTFVDEIARQSDEAGVPRRAVETPFQIPPA